MSLYIDWNLGPIQEMTDLRLSSEGRMGVTYLLPILWDTDRGEANRIGEIIGLRIEGNWAIAGRMEMRDGFSAYGLRFQLGYVDYDVTPTGEAVVLLVNCLFAKRGAY